MNLTEGMSAMVTATANREVTADVTIVTLMRDRAASTAGDDDYMAEAITIEAGMMMGTTMVMAVDGRHGGGDGRAGALWHGR